MLKALKTALVIGVIYLFANVALQAQTMEEQRLSEIEQEKIELEALKGLPYLTLEDTLKYQRALKGDVEPPAADGSLLFTTWEHALLREFRNSDINTRPLDAGEMARLDGEDGKPRQKGIREISLGGIVYAGNNDWTVWLNGQRLKPDAIPKEVLDINVRKEYIEIKWYDAYTQLIFPLRLRPHQRFNLDSRIFLPGTGLAADKS